MVLMQIGIHSIKALFVLTLIMMGTPPCCIPLSPTYATLSLPCSVLDPISMLELREKLSLMLGDLQFSFCKITITNYFTS